MESKTLRSLIALAVASIVFFAGFATASTAAAGAPEVPDTFGAPAARLGDEWRYQESWYQNGTPYVAAEGQTQERLLERREGAAVHDAWGRPATTTVLSEQRNGTDGQDDWSVQFHHHLDEEGATVGITRETLRIVAQASTTIDPGFGGTIGDQERVYRKDSILTYDAVEAPCGHTNDLQGRNVSLARPVYFAGACGLGDGASFIALGTEEVPIVLRLRASSSGQGGLVNVEVEGELTMGQTTTAVVFGRADDPLAMQLWMVPGVPVPVRILDRPAQHVTRVLDMAWFSPGFVAQAFRAPDAALPAVKWEPSQPWGMDETGIEHPFPLSAAYLYAWSQDGRLQDFLDGHPGAYVAQASFASVHVHEGTATETMEYRWSFMVTDGDAYQAFRVTKHVPSGGAWSLDQRLAEAATTYEVEAPSTSPSEPLPAPGQVPDHWPTVASLWDRYQVVGDEPNAWGFLLTCDDSCHNVTAVFAGGVSRLEEPYEVDITSNAYATLGLDAALAVGQDGRTAWLATTERTHQESIWGPTYGPGMETEAVTGAYVASSAPEWKVPSAAVAAGIGIVSLLAGVIAYVLSGGKLAIFGLWRKDSLEHPVRQEIMEILHDEPGIHHKELMRRLEAGNHVVRHHIDRLMAGGHVVAQAGPRFTCYFPKGKVDRRVMAAAPVLRSGAARDVLATVAQEPGCTGRHVAQRLQVSPGTVSFHLKRLAEAGLLEPKRDGRALCIFATDTGHAALAAGLAA